MSIQSHIGAIAALYNDGGLKSTLRKWWNFSGSYSFDSRSTGASGLVLIVAGHKPRLWPMVFPRFNRFLPQGWDVCLVVPGKKDPVLEEIAERYGWSLLATRANKLGLAQNHAVRLHPHAEYLCKLDEDIFISHGFLEGLFETLEEAEAGGLHRPGFVAPILNVNGFTSRLFLEELGQLRAFEEKFGVLPSGCFNSPAWGDPEAAAFLWKILIPFDEVAKRFAAASSRASICHHRFSIGAILLRRAVWKSMEGFSVSAPGVLGAEEGDLCAWCVEHSRAMVIAHRVLVGHAGFQPQVASLLPLLENRADLALQPAIPHPHG